jgi:hypothetical protein
MSTRPSASPEIRKNPNPSSSTTRIVTRRIVRTSLPRSPRAAVPARRSSSGMTSEFDTIVESAIVSTITIPVAADSPPMKTSNASALCCCSAST